MRRGIPVRELLCRLGRHRLVPYDPNWPLMTCLFCGKELK